MFCFPLVEWNFFPRLLKSLYTHFQCECYAIFKDIVSLPFLKIQAIGIGSMDKSYRSSSRQYEEFIRGGVGEKQLISGRNHNCSITCQYSQVINTLVASVKGLLVITYFLFDYKPLDLFEWKEKCAVSRVNEGTCKLMSKSRY